MKLNDLLTLLFLSGQLALAQPSNDACSNADQLCLNVVLQGTTTGATADVASDYDFCFTSSSTVWYKFTTDSDGGSVTISISNLSFNPDVTMGQQIQGLMIGLMTSSSPACNTTSYTPISACGSGATDFSVTSAITLAANTTYYFVLDGIKTGAGVTQSAQCDFDITVSGDGVDQVYPTASISATNTVLCFGQTELVSSTISNAADTVNFNWYFNNTLLISDPSANTYDAGTLSGNGYLKLIFESDAICTVSDTTDSIYFEVTPISANAGPDKFISQGDQVTLEGSGDGNPTWTPGSSLTSTTVFTPIATPTNTTTYFLTVDNGACTATDSVNVFVGELVVIYSSFTPNGDNINDKWVITNSAQFDNIEIWVYDRSGQQVFHTTSYDVQEKWWDGTRNNKGDALPASTYFYVIDLHDGTTPPYKGPVTIIR